MEAHRPTAEAVVGQYIGLPAEHIDPAWKLSLSGGFLRMPYPADPERQNEKVPPVRLREVTADGSLGCQRWPKGNEGRTAAVLPSGASGVDAGTTGHGHRPARRRDIDHRGAGVVRPG